MSLTNQQTNQLNELIHQIKWDGGFTVEDTMEIPMLDDLEIHITGTYQIEDPVAFKSYLLSVPDIDMPRILNHEYAKDALLDVLTELTQNGLMSYTQGVKLVDYNVTDEWDDNDMPNNETEN